MADELLHPHPPRPPPSLRPRAEGCGEIVEVKGGHIVRSTGRKDRHSKVCTAKGPRDRRVRLSANTAIQFYDVQDRLGFDRPSKAVDWLIKKAKTSIDKLAQLPPWNPDDVIRQAASNAKPKRATAKTQISPSPPQQQQLLCGGVENPNNNENESSFLSPSMDSDLITDTIKSFFPVVCSSVEAPPNHQLMHDYHHQHPPGLLSRTNIQNQDLRLSLQSSLLHHHTSASASEPVLFNPLGFDTSNLVNWEQHSSEFGRIQRLLASNSGGDDTTSFQRVLGQSQELYAHRSPLQSSYSPMIRAWFDPHHHQQSISTVELSHHHQHLPLPVHQGEFSSGFQVPARFQGQEEEQHDKPTSSSSLAIDN